MKIEKQIEAAARCDDYFNLEYVEHQLTGGNKYGAWIGNHRTHTDAMIPDYAKDYNAVVRLRDGLIGDDKSIYCDYLLLIVSEQNGLDHRKQDAEDATHFATCAQMLEAYLKAKGVWVDETEGE